MLDLETVRWRNLLPTWKRPPWKSHHWKRPPWRILLPTRKSPRCTVQRQHVVCGGTPPTIFQMAKVAKSDRLQKKCRTILESTAVSIFLDIVDRVETNLAILSGKLQFLSSQSKEELLFVTCLQSDYLLHELLWHTYTGPGVAGWHGDHPLFFISLLVLVPNQTKMMFGRDLTNSWHAFAKVVTCIYHILFLCQIKPSWSLTKISELIEALILVAQLAALSMKPADLQTLSIWGCS